MVYAIQTTLTQRLTKHAIHTTNKQRIGMTEHAIQFTPKQHTAYYVFVFIA